MRSVGRRVAALIALLGLGLCGTAHADTVCSQKSSSNSMAVCFSVVTSTAVGANVVIQAWVEERTTNGWQTTYGSVSVREGSTSLVSGGSDPGRPFSTNYTFQTAVQHVLYARAPLVGDSPTISVNVNKHTPVFTSYTVLPAISRVGQSVRLKIDTDLYRPSGGVLAFYVTPPGGTAATFTTRTISEPNFHIIAHSEYDFAFATPYTAPGNYQFYVKYLGDALNNVFQSPTLTVSVGPFATNTSLTQSSNTSQNGSAFTLTAAVSTAQTGVAAPTGNVEFFDGTTLLGTVAIDALGAAALSTTQVRSTGTHSLTARYAGDTNYLTSSSSPVTHSITFNPAVLVPIYQILLEPSAPPP